jgi:hypothetical protein
MDRAPSSDDVASLRGAEEECRANHGADDADRDKKHA